MEEYDDTDKEIDAQINEQLSQLIVNDIGPFTCQLFKHDPVKKMVPFASGVLAELGGSHYILTASHVTEDWSDENQLFVQIHGGYMSVVGGTRGTEIEKSHRIDVAYIKLKEPNIIQMKKGNKFLTIDRFKGHPQLLDSADYCVFGYPTINAERIDGKLKTKGAAYFLKPSKEKVLDYYGFHPMSHFALEFKGKGVNIKTNEAEKVKTQHYGLSGCGLWLTYLDHDGQNFTSGAKLIGIMTEFRRAKYDCLIGCKIEIIFFALRDFEGFNFRTK